MLQVDDTIVAISTAAGSAARAIVRLSGPEALPLAGTVFSPAVGRLEDLGGFRAADGIVRFPAASTQGDAAAGGESGSCIELPGRVYVFRAPRSYTRQDVVELHLPGAAPAVASLVARLVEAGARPAQPGEFTARAFLSGRLDLSAAEAVADIIDAADAAQLRAAMSALDGRIFRLCQAAAAEAADVLAVVEASIDLADEHVELDAPAALSARLDKLAAHLRGLARQASDAPETADRPRAAIAGRPNVGKSSLLNALTGSNRAIVSAISGTTRDVLTAPLSLEHGMTLLLQDAAGFVPRPAADAPPHVAPLTQAADDAAHRAVARADVLLLVVDASADSFGEDLAVLDKVRRSNARAPLTVLANKADLLDPDEADVRAAELRSLTSQTVIATSALTGEGLDQVRRALAEQLTLHAARAGDALGLNQRHKRCLLAAAEAVDAAGKLLAGAAEVADVAELAAVELRRALAELGAISGQVVTEDILGRIFVRFCVGK